MKQIFIILISLSLFACKSNPGTVTAEQVCSIPVNCDSLVSAAVEEQKEYLQAEVKKYEEIVSAMKADNDSLSTKLFLAEHRIERVRYYLGIVDRNRSQEVFLRGWIRRAIE